MPENAVEKEAYNIADQIHNGARIMETALLTEDVESKKALRNAAKTVIDAALKRFDESIAVAIGTDQLDDED